MSRTNRYLWRRTLTTALLTGAAIRARNKRLHPYWERTKPKLLILAFLLWIWYCNKFIYGL